LFKSFVPLSSRRGVRGEVEKSIYQISTSPQPYLTITLSLRRGNKKGEELYRLQRKSISEINKFQKRITN
jgi:hypothetical protein